MIPNEPAVPDLAPIAEPGVRCVWHEDPVPPGLPVTQVYGWLICPVSGRVLVQEHDDGICILPGGTPEEYDADQYATLAREAFEESQVRIGPSAVYLGYQEVFEPGGAPIAQVRMAAVITEFAARAPDTDGGGLYQRLMTSLAAAPAYRGDRPRARMVPPSLLSAEVIVACVSTAKPASLSHAIICSGCRRWT
jgi:8-oxo-dGTP diphosphatase